ncbi:hypothetical protein AAVH_07216 [Aphelenchoides avenae]|nr:hypothetical protein AAVH_07216 [Aphelenchus avenae]
MLKSALPVAIVVVAFAQFASTFWNWEQTAAMSGQFVCNTITNFTGKVFIVMVDRYAPADDPSRTAAYVKENGTFNTVRVIRKMTPFLPALDVYHKCFDATTTNCTCFMLFRLGVDAAKGNFLQCVSLGRHPQKTGWRQAWCNSGIIDLQAYTNATCDEELCGGE